MAASHWGLGALNEVHPSALHAVQNPPEHVKDEHPGLQLTPPPPATGGDAKAVAHADNNIAATADFR